VLGLIEGAEFESVRGVMRPGDALVMYTDGLVETAKREIELGIDRLIGEVEKALHAATQDRVDRLVERLGTKDDDRAMLLVHRSA
jgi:serine phosphatase RsbU (regulator of sigma subunit)